MNVRTRRAGTPTGRLRSRLGSGERAGVRESIYESGDHERAKQRPRLSKQENRSRRFDSFRSPDGSFDKSCRNEAFSLLDIFVAMTGLLVPFGRYRHRNRPPEKPKQFIYVLRLVPRLGCGRELESLKTRTCCTAILCDFRKRSKLAS